MRSRMLAGRIYHDLELGLIVRVDEGKGHGAEVLPVSRLYWRLEGAPTGWRHRDDAAERLRGSL